ncbi:MULTISPECIES: sensor histidine kinase [Olivibacter]|jgi:signal transduction histidine kinase|uniref:histidine kinase n=1 Tax=Olivibacter oleidegradans TaxID=760123 RepID=A0ABV6HLI7_9SPHI|nr:MULTISPECIES: HAMP domain-containing sensor histidine kinase [Olivibacter]QEL02516.1 HAMP domain-containing histidine kinase [Olivibacter sp. LS-1]
MKLADKFTLWFLAIILLVTPISMFTTLSNIRNRIDNSEIERLKAVNNEVAEQLKAGIAPDQYSQGRPIAILKINSALPQNRVQVQKQQCDSTASVTDECRITVSCYYTINGINYQVSSYNYVTQSKQILKGMLLTAILKTVLIALVVLLTVRLVSKKILSPFNQTLKSIQKFSIKKKQPLTLNHTNTKEFQELNRFLKKMTDKAIKEYSLVKEFSENASHELQTPLAVLRSKLELLTETDIQQNQASLIADMQNAIEKLSKINHSLLLLTKLENQEFEATKEINFTKQVLELLTIYEDRIAIKELKVTQHIDPDITVRINPALADMLFDNLLSNAIRHNVKNGTIFLEINKKGILIKNTGPEPIFPTEELFQRFKKSNQCSNSVGLGLAIVKRICELNNFDVQYTYENRLHMLTVDFPRAGLTETDREEGISVLGQDNQIVTLG